MNITDVRIRKVNVDSKVLAVASVTFEGVFVVHDIKVIHGEKGVFIAMPSRRKHDGEYIDIAHPINQEFRNYIEDTIINELAKFDDLEGENEEKEHV